MKIQSNFSITNNKDNNKKINFEARAFDRKGLHLELDLFKKVVYRINPQALRPLDPLVKDITATDRAYFLTKKEEKLVKFALKKVKFAKNGQEATNAKTKINKLISKITDNATTMNSNDLSFLNIKLNGIEMKAAELTPEKVDKGKQRILQTALNPEYTYRDIFFES